MNYLNTAYNQVLNYFTTPKENRLINREPDSAHIIKSQQKN